MIAGLIAVRSSHAPTERSLAPCHKHIISRHAQSTSTAAPYRLPPSKILYRYQRVILGSSRTTSFLVFAAVTTLILFYFMSNPTTTPTSAGWHARVLSSPPLTDFVPTRDLLQFTLLRSTPAQPEGLTLALFAPDIAIDAAGRVHHIQASDFATLTTLSTRILDLPNTGSFMNTWRIRQPT